MLWFGLFVLDAVKFMVVTVLLVVLTLAVVVRFSGSPSTEPAYHAETSEWRAVRRDLVWWLDEERIHPESMNKSGLNGSDTHLLTREEKEARGERNDNPRRDLSEVK